MSASWETYPGTTDRIMLITGRPEEVINAQSLVWDNITQQIADEGKHDSMCHTDIKPSMSLLHFISVIYTAYCHSSELHSPSSVNNPFLSYSSSLSHTRTSPFSSHICLFPSPLSLHFHRGSRRMAPQTVSRAQSRLVRCTLSLLSVVPSLFLRSHHTIQENILLLSLYSSVAKPHLPTPTLHSIPFRCLSVSLNPTVSVSLLLPLSHSLSPTHKLTHSSSLFPLQRALTSQS